MLQISKLKHVNFFKYRFFLTLLILILSFQSWTEADDIREFEIDGMSIGDSILLNYNKDEIENKISNRNVYVHKGAYYEAYFLPKDQDNYDYIKITWKQTDKTYEIFGVGGVIEYPDNFNECLVKQKKIINEIENLFENTKRNDHEKHPSVYDSTGDSYFIETNFEFVNGDTARVYCSYWSKKMFEEKGYVHTLSFLLNTDEFLTFLEKNY